MEFRILGPLEVLAAGKPLPQLGPKQRALLAVLLLHANEVVSSDRLVDELWPDERDAGVAALQASVSRLRKALGAGGSRLLASASLAVQRALGVAAEPLLVERGEGLAAPACEAAVAVVGLSDRWRKEGWVRPAARWLPPVAQRCSYVGACGPAGSRRQRASPASPGCSGPGSQRAQGGGVRFTHAGVVLLGSGLDDLK